MPVTVAISEPSTDTASVTVSVGGFLQITITSQCKLCCTNPELFNPVLPDGALLNAGFSKSYEGVTAGTSVVSTVGTGSNCGQIAGTMGRSVHVSAGMEGAKKH